MNSDSVMLPPFKTASILAHALYDRDIRHAIISPGSRSTPLTLALAHHDGFEKIVALDERSAAFIALGIGKESGRPAVLVCTSGTAAANYFPAISEAKQSGVPMIVLTADRPPNLRGTGSSQTIDQLKLYGGHAVFFHEMGEPADTRRDRDRIRFAARQAASESMGKGGAAHLNLPFRKPLEPSREAILQVKSQYKKQISESTSNRSVRTRSVSPSNEICDLVNSSSRPLVIAGPANRHHSNGRTTLKMADILHAPVIAEPGSRIGPHRQRIHRFEQFLRSETIRKQLRPDLVLRFGDQPFTKSMLMSLNNWADVPTLHFDARNSWQDHEMSVDVKIELTPGDTFITDAFKQKKDDYLDMWSTADADSSNKLQKTLDRETSLTDGHLFHHISNSLRVDWNLMLSNSLPTRDAALFGNPVENVIVNRGAAGIDGIISTAIGASRASQAPTCCVVGDLAFLHDSNALLSVRHAGTPFMIIVINNGGGNIFRMLPVYKQTDTYQPYFETPQDVDIQHIAKAHGFRYKRVQEKKNLHQISFDESRIDKPLIIECITNADAGMAMRKRLWEGS